MAVSVTGNASRGCLLRYRIIPRQTVGTEALSLGTCGLWAPDARVGRPARARPRLARTKTITIACRVCDHHGRRRTDALAMGKFALRHGSAAALPQVGEPPRWTHRPGLDQDEALQRHATAHSPVSDCPLLAGAGVTLLPGGGETLTAIFKAVAAARHQLLMEYYIFEDVHWRGRSLVDLLVEKMGQGVQVAISYDGAGSQDTNDVLFDRLRQAGAALLEFRPLNPLRRRFNPLTLNDRDHRKLLVVDRRIAFLGGVNMSRVYENPRSAGPATDTEKAFWYDAAVRIEGPPVAEVQKLFFHSWQRQGGDPLAQGNDFPALPEKGEEVCTHRRQCPTRAASAVFRIREGSRSGRAQPYSAYYRLFCADP